MMPMGEGTSARFLDLVCNPRPERTHGKMVLGPRCSEIGHDDIIVGEMQV
jgi:hypothetical protein